MKIYNILGIIYAPVSFIIGWVGYFKEDSILIVISICIMIMSQLFFINDTLERLKR